MESLVALCIDFFIFVVFGRYSRRSATEQVYPTATIFLSNILKRV